MTSPIIARITGSRNREYPISLLDAENAWELGARYDFRKVIERRHVKSLPFSACRRFAVTRPAKPAAISIRVVGSGTAPCATPLTSNSRPLPRRGSLKKYKPTIAITELLIPADTPPKGEIRFDGLMYPTIAMAGNCENFALRPEFVTRGLAFVKAEHLVIQENAGRKMRFNVNRVADTASKSGTLNWRLPKWTVEPGACLAFDLAGNGVLTVRAPDGTIVPPR